MSMALAFEDQVEVSTTNQSNNRFTGYTIVPNQVWGKLEEYSLSPSALSLYFKILSMCYGKKRFCFPSQAFLAEVFHCSTRTIQNWLKELVNAELISVRHRRNKSNIYNIIDIVEEEKLSTLSTGDTPNVASTPDVCETEFALDAKLDSERIITPLRNTNSVCMLRDSDDVLNMIRVLGDYGIDVDSPRGKQYEKLYHQEKATPEQLRIALQVIDMKIKQGIKLFNEFGLAVNSIRQSQGKLVLVQPSNQNFGQRSDEGKRTERTGFKSSMKQPRHEGQQQEFTKAKYYEGFYL